MTAVTPSSLAERFDVLSRRLDALERAARMPALTVAGETVNVSTDLKVGLSESWTSFDGAAEVSFTVPPSGRILVMCGGVIGGEMDSVEIMGVYLSPEFSGANTIAAGDAEYGMNLYWFTDGISDPFTFFFRVITGMAPGETTAILRRSRTFISDPDDIVSCHVQDQSLAVIPL